MVGIHNCTKSSLYDVVDRLCVFSNAYIGRFVGL